MKLIRKNKQTLMSQKYYSMLLGGTLTMVVFSMLMMSDLIIAGACIGSDAVAGITLVNPLYSLANFFSSVFSLGVPIVYSEELGRFNKRGADQAFGFGLFMSIVAGVLLFLLVVLFGDMYLLSSHPTEAALAEARAYLYWMRFTVLILPLQTLLLGVVFSDGDETLCTISNLVQSVGNLLASIFLSRLMGTRGIALASLLFNLISMLILFSHFLKKTNSLRINLYFSFDALKTITQYSIIDASSYLFLSIQVAILNAFVSARYGSDYLILVSVITLGREYQMVFDGIGEAITPILGVYLGEECYSGVRSTYKLAERTSVAEGIGVTLVMLLFSSFIPGILDISDPALSLLAVTETRLISLGSVFVSLLYLLTSYYLLIEKIPLGMIISALRDVLFTLPLAVVSGAVFGVYGLCAGMAAAPAVCYGLTLAYIALRYGRDNCPLFLGLLKGDTQSELFNLTTEPEQIIEIQQKVGRLLEEHSYDDRSVNRVQLLIEELFMLFPVTWKSWCRKNAI